MFLRPYDYENVGNVRVTLLTEIHPIGTCGEKTDEMFYGLRTIRCSAVKQRRF